MNNCIVAFGDLHLRASIPEKRIDDYLNTQYRKLRWCFRQIPKNAIVAFPGDVFNSAKEPYHLIEMFMLLLNRRKDLFYVFIPGQHDSRYHNFDLHNTPIRLLQAGVQNSVLLDSGGFDIDDFILYGKAYNAETPKPKENTKKRQILIAHKMLIDEVEIFPGQNAILAKTFMRIYPYDIIISGDNHQRFIIQNTHQLLINMGSFMRMKTDQKEHIPGIVIIHNLKPTVLNIPIAPANEVFTHHSITKQLAKIVGSDFIRGIKEDEHKEVSFISRLSKHLKNENEDVKIFIKDCIEKIGE